MQNTYYIFNSLSGANFSWKSAHLLQKSQFYPFKINYHTANARSLLQLCSWKNSAKGEPVMREFKTYGKNGFRGAKRQKMITSIFYQLLITCIMLIINHHRNICVGSIIKPFLHAMRCEHSRYTMSNVFRHFLITYLYSVHTSLHVKLVW